MASKKKAPAKKKSAAGKKTYPCRDKGCDRVLKSAGGRTTHEKTHKKSAAKKTTKKATPKKATAPAKKKRTTKKTTPKKRASKTVAETAILVTPATFIEETVDAIEDVVEEVTDTLNEEWKYKKTGVHFSHWFLISTVFTVLILTTLLVGQILAAIV